MTLLLGRHNSTNSQKWQELCQIHGAYWHNDFGRARSHGCVNVRPEAAQWFNRWTRPVTAYEDALLEVTEGGTPIVVT